MTDHPGAYVRQIITQAGLSIGQAANAISMQRPHLNNVINAKANVTRSIAYKLDALLGTDTFAMAHDLIARQAAWDWEQDEPERLKVLDEIEHVEDIKEAIQKNRAPKTVQAATPALPAPVTAPVAPKTPKKAKSSASKVAVPDSGIELTIKRVGPQGPVYDCWFRDDSRVTLPADGDAPQLPFTLVVDIDKFPLVYIARQTDENGVTIAPLYRHFLDGLKADGIWSDFTAIDAVFSGVAADFQVRGFVEFEQTKASNATARVFEIDFRSEDDAFLVMMKYGGNVRNAHPVPPPPPFTPRAGRIPADKRVIHRDTGDFKSAWSFSHGLSRVYHNSGIGMRYHYKIKSHALLDWAWKNTVGDFRFIGRHDGSDSSLHFELIDDAIKFADMFAHDGRTVNLPPLEAETKAEGRAEGQ